MFRFVQQLEQHFEEIARTVTTEHGKTIDESRGSVRRGIECVEVACGAPSLMMGYGLEQIATNVDSHVFRQPLGVVAAITPFNFPGDGADVVPALRRGDRQLHHRQAVGAGAAVDAADVQAAREVRHPAGRDQHGERRARSGRGDLRSPGHPRGVVRRIDAGRPGRLPARHARRQARAGARRREELRRRHARREFRQVDRDHHRVVLRLRRRAVPGRQRAGAGRRGAPGSAGPPGRIGAQPEGRRRHAGRRADGPRDQRRAPRSREAVHRQGRARRREAGAGRPRRRRRRARPRLLRRPDGLRRGVAEDGHRPRGDLRAGRLDPRGQDARGRDRADGVAPERERDLHLHLVGQVGARVRAAGDGVDGRREHRRRRADGLFPLRRLARQLLRRPQGPRQGRVRVLHRQEGHQSRAGLW